MTKNKSPYKDYNGNDIYEGDDIMHPDLTVGTVVTTDDEKPEDKWRVDYKDGSPLSRLCLQVGDKGRAKVIL